MNEFTHCHRNATLPITRGARVVAKLTRQDCINMLQEIHSRDPQSPEMNFRREAFRNYPPECKYKKGEIQKVWVDTLEDFINDRKKAQEAFV